MNSILTFEENKPQLLATLVFFFAFLSLSPQQLRCLASRVYVINISDFDDGKGYHHTVLLTIKSIYDYYHFNVLTSTRIFTVKLLTNLGTHLLDNLLLLGYIIGEVNTWGNERIFVFQEFLLVLKKLSSWQTDLTMD